MDKIGPLHREVQPDLFAALINSIVGQQISTKAQKTIWQRIEERFAPVTPQSVCALSLEDMQACGISFRKAAYIKEVAELVAGGQLNLDSLHCMPDEQVCDSLSKLKGIGKWTAEMLMTFSMQRPDVISNGDLAILRGLRMLYRHRKISPSLFEKYKRRYSPYASIASLYLWAIAGGACPALSDPALKKGVRKRTMQKKAIKEGTAYRASNGSG